MNWNWKSRGFRIDRNCQLLRILDNCFFFDGVGGAGKTFLNNLIIKTLLSRGKKVIAVASTGIAATLMLTARTAHSAFKIPVPCVENSTSSIKLHTPEAKELEKADLVLWDEATMASADMLKVVNGVFQFVRKNKLPFGGVTTVFSGDFRQCLTVVEHGNKTTIIEACLQSCFLWCLFEILRLTENMRTGEGEKEYADFILKVGNGEVLLMIT